MTGRGQLVDLTREEEAALGYQSYQQVLSQENVIHSGEVVDQVREIGMRLAKAAADVDPGFEWEFNVIDSEQANAFALPGGKVAVYTGFWKWQKTRMDSAPSWDTKSPTPSPDTEPNVWLIKN